MLQISMPFPEGGLGYDYCLDDGGVSKTGEEEDEEEMKKSKGSYLKGFYLNICATTHSSQN